MSLNEQTVLPVMEERLTLHTEKRNLHQVRIEERTHEVPEVLTATLREQAVAVDRLPLGQYVDHMPSMRETPEGWYIPVVEEHLVITKRLYLKEEVLVRHIITDRVVEQTATRRVQEVHVEIDPTPQRNTP